MEDIQIGSFIRDRRLQLEMTQQQLADKLGVTDKAVSKWERSVSYPDITILRELADALDVSVSELLAGKCDPQSSPVPPEVEDVVLDTVSYAETARQKNGRWKAILFLVLSICCSIGALVCFIFFWITGADRGWATIAIQSIALGWAGCYPLLRVAKSPLRRSLTVLSIAIIPYLASVNPYMFLYLPRSRHSLPIVLLSLAYLWAVYFICTKYWRQKRLVTGWVLLLGGILSAAVTLLIDTLYINFITGIALFAAGIGLLAGYFWERAWKRKWRQ